MLFKFKKSVYKDYGVVNLKISKMFYIILIISILLSNESVSALTINTGLSTEKMDCKDQKIFLSNIHMCLLKEEINKNEIKCFDVNDDGIIAVGLNNGIKKAVNIYTSNGIFKYGYTFDCSGSFGIEWDKDNLIIYFVRSDVAASFDATGNCIKLEKIKNTIDNNSYWNHNVFSTTRKVNDAEYIIKNNMGILNFFATGYSQLVKKDVNGVETIIYDFNEKYLLRTIVFICIIAIFVLIVVIIILREFKKLKANLK